MASSVLNVANPTNEITNVNLAEKCIFCNTLLDGKSKILNCLHIVCKNCLSKKTVNSSIYCKCHSISQDKLIDYPIISPGVPLITKCSEITCNVEANKICILCNKIYCKPCSKVHMFSIANHSKDLIYCYPMKKELIPCRMCKQRCVDVYCTKCSIILCSMCHLSFHRKHKYKILDELAVEIKSNISAQKLELEKNNKYLEFCIKQINDEFSSVEFKKIEMYEKIDKEMEKLHYEVNKRSDELKNSVDMHLSDILYKITDNIKVYTNLLNDNKYHLDLTESILSRGKTSDLVKLSKMVIDKVKSSISDAECIIKEKSEMKMDMKFYCGETIEKCISSIKTVGNISTFNTVISTEIKDLIKNQDKNISIDEIKDEICSNSSNDSECSDSSGYEALVECSSCNQWSEKLITCKTCYRHYHNNCHIPLIPSSIYERSRWKCTLCVDITKSSLNLSQLIMSDLFTVNVINNTPGRKLIEHILLALYCQNNESEHFRELPCKNLYPDYYIKIPNPISLNDIKNRLSSEMYYTNIVEIINDLKQVFSNAMLYYLNEHDPFYMAAQSLLDFLNRMLAEWLPNLI